MIEKYRKNYLVILKRFILSSSAVFISSCCFIFYFKLSLVAGQFADEVKNNKASIEKDFQTLQRIYQAQLIFTKSRIEETNGDKKKIEDFLEDAQILIDVGSDINTIIITDKDFNVRMTGRNTKQSHPVIRLEKGNYRNILKRNPEKIILGEIVESVVTQKPVIPLATGLHDKNGKMLGSIIFSIGLKKLENSLSHGRSFKVFIEDAKTALADYEDYDKLSKFPKLFFIFEILSPMNSFWSISSLEPLSQKYLHIQYNTDAQKMRFIKALVPPYMIILILLIMINLLFYFYVISPMKPVMEILSKQPDNNAKLSNIFSKLTNLVVVQSSTIKKQDQLTKEKQNHILALRDLSKHSVNTIKNISESLTEEIEDIITTQNQSFLIKYREILEEIQQKVINNEHSTKLILNTSVEILRIISNGVKECCSLMQLLLASGVNPTVITESLNFLSDTEHKVSKISSGFMIYKSLFIKLVQEILSYENQVNILKHVFIKDSTIEFLFTIVNNELISGFNINLTRCKILGVFNNVEIKCVYDKNQVSIVCSIISVDE